MATEVTVTAGEQRTRSIRDTTAESPTLKASRNEILKHLTDSAADNKRFIPADVLDRIYTLDGIESCLRAFQKSPSWQAELARFIHGSAKKTFAILVLIGKIPEIERLKDEGFTDEMLPVSYEVADEVWTVRSYQSKSESLNPNSEWKIFRLWDKASIYDFCDRQWMFLAPVFTADGRGQLLHRDTILPFTAIADDVKSSFFSKVYRVKVHEAHQSPTCGYQSQIAVKELHNLQAYSREAEALTLVKDINHLHLIKSIAAFRRGDKQYILFPWADGGNLREFWLSKSLEKDNDARIARVGWVLEQMTGLADGLSKVHDRNVRHGDLKPENILRFNSSEPLSLGTLKIADLGLAKRHNMVTTTRQNATGTMAGTYRYEPPEATSSNDKPLSRRYDNWAMGCIMVEFITWLLRGPEELNRITANIPSFRKATVEPKTTTILVNKNAKKWIEWLREDGWCQPRTALSDLLNLVESKLLVADTLRATSVELARALGGITQRAKSDRQYLFGHPDSNQRRLASASSFMPDGMMIPAMVDCLNDRATVSNLEPTKSSQRLAAESSRRFSSGEQQEAYSDERITSHQRKLAAKGNKRKTQGNKTEDEYDDQDDDDRRIIQRKKRIRSQPQGQQLACPFYKQNPTLFRSHRTCCGPGWPTVRRVKDHIYRSHTHPDGRCPRCLEEFPGFQAYEQHIRQDTRCESREDTMRHMFIDKAVETKLRKKEPKTPAHLKKPEADKWTEMFKVIFPGHIPVPSPYYESDVAEPRGAESIEKFVDFASRMMSHETTVILSMPDLSEDIRSHILALQSFQTRAYRRFMQQPDSKNKNRNGNPISTDNCDGRDRTGPLDAADDPDVPSVDGQEGSNQEEAETCTEINRQSRFDQAIQQNPDPPRLDSVNWIGNHDAVDPVSGTYLGAINTTLSVSLNNSSLPQNLCATTSGNSYHMAHHSMPTLQPSPTYDTWAGPNENLITTYPTPYLGTNSTCFQPSAIEPTDHSSSQAAPTLPFDPQRDHCDAASSYLVVPDISFVSSRHLSDGSLSLQQTQNALPRGGVHLSASGPLVGDLNRISFQNPGNAFSIHEAPGSSMTTLFDSGYHSSEHQLVANTQNLHKATGNSSDEIGF